MEWQTPIGLPVVQPYHKRSSKEVGLHILWEDLPEKIFGREDLGQCGIVTKIVTKI